MKLRLGLAALIVAAPLASASAMPVSAFIAKADGLQRKGMAAMFSGDMKLLKGEVGASTRAIRAEQVAATKAGRKGDFCLPPKASFKSNELLAYLRTIPVAQRSMPFAQAFRGFIVRKYPCPA